MRDAVRLYESEATFLVIWHISRARKHTHTQTHKHTHTHTRTVKDLDGLDQVSVDRGPPSAHDAGDDGKHSIQQVYAVGLALRDGV